MSALKNPALYVVCAVSGKYDLGCIKFLNGNSKNAERNLRQIHYCCCLFYWEELMISGRAVA
jgi:hypothetical protein